MTVRGIIFDKDGTLFDLQATWAGWTGSLVEELAGGDAGAAVRLAEALRFDPVRRRLRPGSILIAGTPDEAEEAILAALDPPPDPTRLRERLAESAASVAPVAAVPLGPLLEALLARGMVLGLVTNDGEAAARAQLRTVGVETRFHTILGYDSGHGAKPDPGPLRAVAALNGLTPDAMVMVGDSPRDLEAGRAAGMATVAIRSDLVAEAALAPLADGMLDDVAALLAWLDR